MLLRCTWGLVTFSASSPKWASRPLRELSFVRLEFEIIIKPYSSVADCQRFDWFCKRKHHEYLITYLLNLGFGIEYLSHANIASRWIWQLFENYLLISLHSTPYIVRSLCRVEWATTFNRGEYPSLPEMQPYLVRFPREKENLQRDGFWTLSPFFCYCGLGPRDSEPWKCAEERLVRSMSWFKISSKQQGCLG